jgi:hypothetical protein
VRPRRCRAAGRIEITTLAFSRTAASPLPSFAPSRKTSVGRPSPLTPRSPPAACHRWLHCASRSVAGSAAGGDGGRHLTNPEASEQSGLGTRSRSARRCVAMVPAMPTAPFYRRSVPLTTKSTSRPPQLEQTSGSRQSRSVLPRQFSGARFDPMAAVAAPHDQAHSGSGGVAQCHRWPGSNFAGGAVPDAAPAPGLVPPVSAVVPVAARAEIAATSREFGATAGYAPTAGTGRYR